MIRRQRDDFGFLIKSNASYFQVALALFGIFFSKVSCGSRCCCWPLSGFNFRS